MGCSFPPLSFLDCVPHGHSIRISVFSQITQSSSSVAPVTLTGSGNTSFIVLLTISHNWIASVVIEAHSNWLFADEVDTSSWMLPDYDDSDWNVKHYGEFPPYNGRRFYRIHVSLDTRALEYSVSIYERKQPIAHRPA